MTLSYKVLLIDDQYQSEAIQQFVLNASYEDIDIECVAFHQDGIAKLEKDSIGQYQAVILDATGYLSEEDFNLGKDLNNVGLTHSLKYLDGKKDERIIPWFIYSGAPRNIGNEEFEENIKVYQSDYKFGRSELCFYMKTNNDHEQALFEDIKTEIDKLSSTRTVLKHTDLFAALQEIPNLTKHRKALIKILEQEKGEQDYTTVRKILESLFKALSEVNILPEGFTEERSWINGTSRFLSGIHEGYIFHDSNFIHPTVCETLYRVLNIVQDGSHNEGKLKYKVDEYSKLHSSGYLYQSVVYALLEIICYFGELIKNNPDLETNKQRWSVKENWIEGSITDLKYNGTGIFTCKEKGKTYLILASKMQADFKLSSLAKIIVKKENINHIEKIELI